MDNPNHTIAHGKSLVSCVRHDLLFRTKGPFYTIVSSIHVVRALEAPYRLQNGSMEKLRVSGARITLMNIYREMQDTFRMKESGRPLGGDELIDGFERAMPIPFHMILSIRWSSRRRMQHAVERC